MHVTIFDRPYAFSNASQSTLKFCKASKANAGRDLETLRGLNERTLRQLEI